MSFNNTKTPLKPKGTRGRKYEVTRRKDERGFTLLLLTPEQEEIFRREYPVMMNPDLMRRWGVSCTTLHRFARRLGLTKDRDAILKAHARQVKRICERNGYYDSIRGKAPSQAAIEGTRRLRATGWNPWDQLKESDPKRHARLLAERGRLRSETYRRERRRVDMGLSSETRLHVPQFNYSKCQLSFRMMARRRGYEPGSIREFSGERYTIWITDATVRSAVFERHGSAMGFTFKERPATRRHGTETGARARRYDEE